MKRIFSYFILSLVLLLSFSQYSFAAATPPPNTSPTCQISLSTTLLVAGSNNNFTVKVISNKSLPVSGPLLFELVGSAFSTFGDIEPVNTDINGDFTYTYTDFINLDQGTFKVYVLPNENIDNVNTSDVPNNALCESSDFSVGQNTTGDRCALSVSSDSNNGLCFSTAANITIKISSLSDPNDSSMQPNVTHRLKVFNVNDPTNPITLPGGNDPCPTTTQLLAGYKIPTGTFPAGTYTAQIMNKCDPVGSVSIPLVGTVTDEVVSCDTSLSPFTITAAGTNQCGPVVGANSQVCYSCAPGSAYTNFKFLGNNPFCTDPSGKTTPATNDGYCDSTRGQVCDTQNHVFGCNGSTGGSGAAANPTPPPNPPPCAGSCSSIQTGLGINLPTDAVGFATAVMGMVLAIGGLIALLIIIITGYKVLTSQGDPEKIKGARESLTAAIAGLLFIIFSLAILSFVGVSVIHIPGFGSASNASIRINGDKTDCGPQGC